MSIFKKKNYIDMRCPRCGGRVYEKECSFYCENCGQYPRGSDAYEEAKCVYYGPRYRERYEREKRLQEEASAVGDTRKVIGETYVEYLQDQLKPIYMGYKYSTFFHVDATSEYYYHYANLVARSTHNNNNNEIRMGEKRLNFTVFMAYKDIKVDPSRTNDREITIVFDDFIIDYSGIEPQYFDLYDDNGIKVRTILKKHGEIVFEDFKKMLIEDIREYVKFLKLTTYGFDDKYADHIYLEFR